MKCHCGNKCFTYTNSSKGVRVWKCASMRETLVRDPETKAFKWVDSGLVPCAFVVETPTDIVAAFTSCVKI